MSYDRLHQWLVKAGLVISAVLLIRFAIDFCEGTRWWLAAPFGLLVVAALIVGLSNITRKAGSKSSSVYRQTEKGLLLAVIPLGFLASSLDCTGLSAHGCSPFCTFVKFVWIPIIASACVFAFLTGKRARLLVVSMLSFIPLAPHCVCYNLGNAWWIDRLGASPLCYGWGFVVSIIAVGALRRGGQFWPSLLVCLTIITGGTAFFISHHYLQFPW